MSTNGPMTCEELDAIRGRVGGATDGPWAAWEDQDGQPHMQGRLMVGVAAGVIPDGATWVEGPDVNNPVAETYTPEDRTFIAHAREDVPALLAEVERRGARLTVDDDMVERAKRAFGAATAQVSSIPLGMSEDMFIDSVGLQHQHAIRAALDVALYHTATHSKEDQ